MNYEKHCLACGLSMIAGPIRFIREQKCSCRFCGLANGDERPESIQAARLRWRERLNDLIGRGDAAYPWETDYKAVREKKYAVVGGTEEPQK